FKRMKFNTKQRGQNARRGRGLIRKREPGRSGNSRNQVTRNVRFNRSRSTKVIIEPHRHAGVFVARGKEDYLVTKSMVPGESVYGEKRISVEIDGKSIEYRVWNPFRSKLAAGILGGLDEIYIYPGSKVLYLGAAIFADIAQPDQARIIALNAHTFLKNSGGIVISIKANCIDSTVDAATVFAREVKKLQEEKIKPQEQLTLEPYEVTYSDL
ncbi:hypothetical protein PCK1_000675, partial [Pneumocystis canis]